tara:strand:- start:30 stop:338 length:309 start_codon:yes stop_codon:yes gene_type:complete
MGFKMKGCTFHGSPLNRGKKTISEDTDTVKKDAKGKDYSLALHDNDTGVNAGDTLFVNKNNLTITKDNYIEGSQNLKLKETKDSKKRTGKGPRSYNAKKARR